MKKKLTLEDFLMLLLIITTLAFHNYSKVLAIVQIACCLIVYFNSIKKGTIQKSIFNYVIWFGIFTFFGGLSILWARMSETNVFLTLRSLLQELMVGLAILFYMKDDNKANNILVFLFWGSIFLVSRLIIEVPKFAWGSERVGIYIGYGNNSAPLVLSYVAIIAFHFFQEKKGKIYALLTILFIIFSLLCGSKKSIIISLLGISILLLLKSKNILQVLKRTVIVLIISSTLFYGVMKIEPLYNVLGNRVEKMFLAFSNKKGGDMSTIDRMKFAKIAFDVFKKNPIIGVGLDNYRFYNDMHYYSHNNYLELMANLGVIGLLLYYCLPIKMMLSSLKDRKNKNKVLIFAIMFVIIVLDVANVSYESDSTQIYIAIMYGLSILYKNKLEEKKVDV